MKAHSSSLESNPRFFRQNHHRATASNPGDEKLKKLAHRWRLVLEMRFQLISAAKMGLISIGKKALTNRATPERFEVAGLSSDFML